MNCCFPSRLEYHRLLQIEDVAGFRIGARRGLRLRLIDRRRLDVGHEPGVAGFDAIRGDLLRVGRPHERVETVGVALGSVGAQRARLLRPAGGTHVDVVVLNERLGGAIGGHTLRRRRAGARCAATTSLAAATLRWRGRRERALVIGERASIARPGGRATGTSPTSGTATDPELNRAARIDERERRERQRRRGVTRLRR